MDQIQNNEDETRSTFDMSSLQTNLPQEKGLSRYYSGKARSFTCMGDVHCLEDLKKQEHPDAKKWKLKYLNRKREVMPNNSNNVNVPPYPCRSVSSSSQCATPYVH